MRPDPAAPLPDVEPPDATVRAFDALGLEYERAFRDLPGLHAALGRLLDVLPPESRVLDVGSGTGRPVAERLAAAGHRVLGIDVSPVMVDIARGQAPQARFEQADVRTAALQGHVQRLDREMPVVDGAGRSVVERRIASIVPRVHVGAKLLVSGPHAWCPFFARRSSLRSPRISLSGSARPKPRGIVSNRRRVR